MFFGFLLILIGILLMLDKLGIINGDFWDYFWPVILVALGLSMIFKDRKKN
ncbi:MAG: DUF5668 domain-containing protein [candidate division Zixibacteria bacterium]|nr:DUF5668 domain-containing protein [candidate division Zixibacteria bacterium]MDD5425975.1 DUF5668 domain-containing protein [candidate division Zixibacteria bacterium]